MTDLYDQYLRGVSDLLEVIEPADTDYLTVLTLQNRLAQAVTEIRQYSPTEGTRAEIARVTTELDRVCLARLGRSFRSLCGVDNLSEAASPGDLQGEESEAASLSITKGNVIRARNEGIVEADEISQELEGSGQNLVEADEGGKVNIAKVIRQKAGGRSHEFTQNLTYCQKLMSRVFVNRQSSIDQFHEIFRDNDLEWVLIVGGERGIGKTAVLNHLRSRCPSSVLVVAGISFASPSLRCNHLSLLDILEYELTAHFQVRSLEGYKQSRRTAYERFELERIQVINQIKAEAGGSISAGTIIQEADVDLSKVLYEHKLSMRDDLTRELVEVVGDYLVKNPEVRIVVLVDDFESLDSSVDGQETANWFLGQLLGGIHRKASAQLRAVISDPGCLNWLTSVEGEGIIRHRLRCLSPEYVCQYLRQRSINGQELQQAIYELTQGHPLCMALAADLCCIAPNLTPHQIKGLSLDGFDSAALAYCLFQSIVERMPDKAVKRLLQYGPVCRVIDDKVVRQVLATELDFVGREDELFYALGSFSFVEGTKELSFKPIIRDRYLEELRRIATADPFFRAVNLRAAALYGQEAQQAPTEERRQAFELDALYHQFNLEPRGSRRQWGKMADEAITNLDYSKLSALLDLAQSPDFGWSSPDTRGLDKGIVKMYESRYYRVIGRIDQAEASQREAERLMHGEQPTPIVRLPSGGPLRPEYDFDRDRSADFRLPSLRPAWEQLVSLLHGAYCGTSRALSWLFVLFGYIAKALLSVVRSIIHYLMSPLRQLERYLRRLKRIVRRVEEINGQVTNEQIPRVARIRATAIELRNRIAHQTLPRIQSAMQSAQQLATDIHQALKNQAALGSVSASEYSRIDNGIASYNQLINRFKQEVASFRKQHDRLQKIVSEAEEFLIRLNKELADLSQESRQPQQEAARLYQELQAAAGRLSPEERIRVGKVMEEVGEYSHRKEVSMESLRNALRQYEAVIPQARSALNDLDNGISSVNGAMGDLNRFIAQFHGVRLVSAHGRIMKIEVVAVQD
jgi:predicted  nucleic acid-binding Zn-ribbon protein